MKKIILLSLIILLYNIDSSNTINTNLLNKQNQNDKKQEVKDNKNIVLLSVNYISVPHYYPDYGLNIRNEDPFGNTYNNHYNAGELSIIGKNQTILLAREIYQNYTSISNAGLKREEMVVIAPRLKRAIDTGKMLNEELLKLTNISYKDSKVLKFNLSNFNITSTSKGSELYNTVFSKQNLKKDDIATFYIPSNYEQSIFPVNFQLNKCKKLNSFFEANVDSSIIKNSMKYYFTENIKKFGKFLKNTTFERVINKKYVNYLNFTEFILNNNWEANKILVDYMLTFELLKNTDIILNKSKLDEKLFNALFLEGNNIFQMKSYDLFFVKNFSDDLIRTYMSGIFKHLLQIIYSKLSNSNDINSQIKLMNYIVNDYNIAGIYKTLINNNLIPSSAGEGTDINTIPIINYGSKITLNMVQDTTNPDKENIITSISIEIYYNNVKKVSLKLLEFIEKMNSLVAEESFFENLC